MDSAVLSQAMLDQIGEREIESAIFTTFTFDPEFFELEIIPLLLDRNLPYSTDDVIKRLTVRENLRSANVKLDVYFDQPQFIESGYSSPQMEYGYYGVTQPNGVFHPKTVLLLVRDAVTNERVLLHCAGSNNLTRAGWWDNIECTHWMEYSSKEIPANIRAALLAELNLLDRYLDSDRDSASVDIRTFLESCPDNGKDDPSYRYFPYSEGASHGRFLRFLSNIFLSPDSKKPWTLEIISPFFADNSKNTEHAPFLDAGVNSIKLLLPLNEQQEARCTADYFQWIHSQEKVEWAAWATELSNTLGVAGKPFRALHAKVYHFYNDEASWVFVGSVNFTHKALNDNAEAGYLLKVDSIAPLLKPFGDFGSIRKFDAQIEESPGSIAADQTPLAKRPNLRFVFDWKSKELKGRLLDDGCVELAIYSFDGHPLVPPVSLVQQEAVLSTERDSLFEYFSKTSFLEVECRWVASTDTAAGEFTTCRIPVAQVNWTHKPLNLPKLTPAQIISIYAGISDEERTLIIQSAKVQQLLHTEQALYDNDPLDGKPYRDFFSEYAEIFNGFRKLRATINLMRDQERYAELDYYLTGTGVDSLPTLVSELVEKNDSTESEKSTEPVTEYLILLSIEGLLRNPDNRARPGVDDLLKQIQHLSIAYESNGRITLDPREQKDPKVFFEWYRAQFFSDALHGASHESN